MRRWPSHSLNAQGCWLIAQIPVRPAAELALLPHKPQFPLALFLVFLCSIPTLDNLFLPSLLSNRESTGCKLHSPLPLLRPEASSSLLCRGKSLSIYLDKRRARVLRTRPGLHSRWSRLNMRFTAQVHTVPHVIISPACPANRPFFLATRQTPILESSGCLPPRPARPN